MAENFGKIDVQKNNVRNSYFCDNKIQYYKNQNYLTIKNECLKSGKLFVDTEFPPTSDNIYYTKRLPKGVKWEVFIVYFQYSSI